MRTKQNTSALIPDRKECSGHTNGAPVAAGLHIEAGAMVPIIRTSVHLLRIPSRTDLSHSTPRMHPLSLLTQATSPVLVDVPSIIRIWDSTANRISSRILFARHSHPQVFAPATAAATSTTRTSKHFASVGCTRMIARWATVARYLTMRRPTTPQPVCISKQVVAPMRLVASLIFVWEMPRRTARPLGSSGFARRVTHVESCTHTSVQLLPIQEPARMATSADWVMCIARLG